MSEIHAARDMAPVESGGALDRQADADDGPVATAVSGVEVGDRRSREVDGDREFRVGEVDPPEVGSAEVEGVRILAIEAFTRQVEVIQSSAKEAFRFPLDGPRVVEVGERVRVDVPADGGDETAAQVGVGTLPVGRIGVERASVSHLCSAVTAPVRVVPLSERRPRREVGRADGERTAGGRWYTSRLV